MNEKAWKRKFAKAMKALEEVVEDVRKGHPKAFLLASGDSIELWTMPPLDWPDHNGVPYGQRPTENKEAFLLMQASNKFLSVGASQYD